MKLNKWRYYRHNPGNWFSETADGWLTVNIQKFRGKDWYYWDIWFPRRLVPAWGKSVTLKQAKADVEERLRSIYKFYGKGLK